MEMPDLSKTAPEQRGMPELLAAPAPCGPRPADRNLHTIRSEVKMPCLRAGRANSHAQSGSELYAILPISKRTFSYRTRPGSRHGPGQGIAGRQELLRRRDPAVVAHAHLGVGERRPVRQTFGHPCRSTPQWGHAERRRMQASQRRPADLAHENHLVSVSCGSAAGHCQAGASVASILMPGTNDGLS